MARSVPFWTRSSSSMASTVAGVVFVQHLRDPGCAELAAQVVQRADLHFGQADDAGQHFHVFRLDLVQADLQHAIGLAAAVARGFRVERDDLHPAVVEKLAQALELAAALVAHRPAVVVVHVEDQVDWRASALMMPARMVRVMKLLPVPLLPNTPDERSTSRSQVEVDLDALPCRAARRRASAARPRAKDVVDVFFGGLVHQRRSGPGWS